MSMFVRTGESGVILRLKLLKLDDGQPLTGLTSATSGLGISVQAMNAAAATTYTEAGGTIEGITTLGTYVTPTTNNCRFKEVDATSQKGMYEFQFDAAVFNVANARNLHVNVYGTGFNLDEGRSTYTISQNILGSTDVEGSVSTALASYGALKASDRTALEGAIAATGSPGLLLDTIITTATSQTELIIAAGSDDDDAYPPGSIVVAKADADPTQVAVGYVLSYTGSTKTLNLIADPGIFTMAADDRIIVQVNAGAALVVARPIPTGAFLGGDTRTIPQKIDELHREQARVKTQSATTQTVMESDGTTPAWSRTVNKSGGTTTFGEAT